MDNYQTYGMTPFLFYVPDYTSLPMYYQIPTMMYTPQLATSDKKKQKSLERGRRLIFETANGEQLQRNMKEVPLVLKHKNSQNGQRKMKQLLRSCVKEQDHKYRGKMDSLRRHYNSVSAQISRKQMGFYLPVFKRNDNQIKNRYFCLSRRQIYNLEDFFSKMGEQTKQDFETVNKINQKMENLNMDDKGQKLQKKNSNQIEIDLFCKEYKRCKRSE